MKTNRNVYTVGQLNRYLRNMFTQDYLLQSLFVKGEVSNCKYHSSGHIYFTLKDGNGTLSCVMYANHRAGLAFRLAEGQQVVVGGAVNVYEAAGKYELYAEQIVLDGAGALYEEYERLKKELAECGMFAPEYKQPIPKYIRTLGVVTAETGAAVRDIIQITQRRNPYVQIILCPALVQGEAAPESIVNGIRALERQGVDVMIVGRGGGSIEDLWAFNDRAVAQAVFDCTVPIISAVGHETDTTIIDYVADLRAPTPSAAAELAVADIRETLGQLRDYRAALERQMTRRITSARERASRYEMRFKYGSPEGKLREMRRQAADAQDRMERRMHEVLGVRRHTLEVLIERMRGLSPLEKLASGFSYVTDKNGKNVRSVRNVRQGDVLNIRVSDGRITATVKDIKDKTYGEEKC